MLRRYLNYVDALNISGTSKNQQLDPILKRVIEDKSLFLKLVIQSDVIVFLDPILGSGRSQNSSWDILGNHISFMFWLKMRYDLVRFPKDQLFTDTIACSQIGELLDAVQIPKDHPSVMAFRGCTNSNGQPDFHNRFTDRSDYETFRNRLIEN